VSGRTGADSHARASADAHPFSDLGDLLAADVVDDRSCLPTRATWRGVRFRFGGGVWMEQLGARAARGEAPLTIEQLRGDFAWPLNGDPASTGCIRFSRGLLPMMSVWPSSTRPLWDAQVASWSFARPPDGLKQATPDQGDSLPDAVSESFTAGGARPIEGRGMISFCTLTGRTFRPASCGAGCALLHCGRSHTRHPDQGDGLLGLLL
jgi:hypothetical protein